MKSIYNIYEASILDIDGSFEEGDNFANLQDWIDNFKNLSAMSANVSSFVKEIKKNGAKPAYDAAVENGKYFVEIIKGDNSTIFSYTLKFYYPDKNEKDYWNYVIIRMQVPRNKLLERRGYKKEIKFLNVEMLKTSISYIKQEVARCISSRTNKMYILPDKYKGIINLIKIEERK